MDFRFESSTVSRIARGSDTGGVKFYGRFADYLVDDSTRMVVEDGDSRLLIDSSTLESQACEQGEWYRFFGEITGEAMIRSRSLTVVRLHLSPRLCDGYERDIYERALSLRSGFLTEFDSLVAYAYR